MDFLTAELIASYHAVPALSDRVKAADFDGPHKYKRPSNHERLQPRHWRQKQKNECGQREGDVHGVWVCVYVCMCGGAGGGGGGGGLGRGWKDDWDKQSVPLQGTEGRQGAVACGYTAKCAGLAFSLARGSIDEWSAAWRFWHTLWHAFLIHCVITCAMLMCTAQETSKGGECKIRRAAWALAETARALLSLAQGFGLLGCYSDWFLCICSSSISYTYIVRNCYLFALCCESMSTP